MRTCTHTRLLIPAYLFTWAGQEEPLHPSFLVLTMSFYVQCPFQYKAQVHTESARGDLKFLIKCFAILVFPLLSLVQAASTNTLYCPEGVRVRKEFRDMDVNEWNDFKFALRALETTGPAFYQYDTWTAIHLRHAMEAHG